MCGGPFFLIPLTTHPPLSSRPCHHPPCFHRCTGSNNNTELPGGTWSNFCTPVTYSNEGLLTADCNHPHSTLSQININMCAPGATLSLNGFRLICSQVAAGLPGEQLTLLLLLCYF